MERHCGAADTAASCAPRLHSNLRYPLAPPNFAVPMHTRIDVGTDIARIGVWDPAHERHDLRTARYADYEAGLQAEARAGRLFFVNTGADGEYPIELYVDEEPPVADLQLYTLREGEFLICSQSGRLMAGGLEDFVSDTKQITSEEDHFEVAPGMYALSVYELQEEEFDRRLPEFIGPEDYAY